MKIEEVEEFSQYVVYEKKENKLEYICICKEYYAAEWIARMLTMEDFEGSSYGVTNISRPNTFVIGGGWSVTFYKDKDGQIHKDEIS